MTNTERGEHAQRYFEAVMLGEVIDVEYAAACGRYRVQFSPGVSPLLALAAIQARCDRPAN